MAIDLPDGWKDDLPEEIKTSGVLDDIKTIDQMATMVVNGRKLQSNQVSIPSEDASAEKRDEFLKDLQQKIPDLVYVGEGADMSKIHDRMGRPADATGYTLGEIPDPLKDNFANLSAKAHELGMSDKQMKGITDTIVTSFNANMDIAAAAQDDAAKLFAKEFGDGAGVKKEAAANFAKSLGFDEGLIGAIKSGAIGVDNMKAFDKIMEGFESPGPRIGDEHGTEFTHLTPAQAELQIDQLLNNKEHPYWDSSSPAHDAAVQKMVELTRAADAGKEQTESEKFREALAGRG